MRKRFLRVCWMIGGFVFVSGPAFGASVTVGCAGAPLGVYNHASIQAAVNAVAAVSLTGPHTITVSGNCTENVNASMDRLTIQGTPGATLAPDLPGQPALNVSSSRAFLLMNISMSGSAGQPAVVFRHTEGTVQNCIVENTGGGGVSLQEGSVGRLQNSTVQGHGAGIGVHVTQSQLQLPPGTNVIENHSQGIRVGLGSTATIMASPVIRGNTIGVNGDHGSLSMVSATLEGNHLAILLSSSRALLFFGSIQQNGVGPAPVFPLGPVVPGGILARLGSVISLGGVGIQNNVGTGINLQSNSTLGIIVSTVTGNTEYGVRIEDVGGMKTGGSIISGNGPNKDIVCDINLSWLSGDLTGVGKVEKCTILK